MAQGGLRVVETNVLGEESTNLVTFDVLRVRVMSPQNLIPDRVLDKNVDYSISINDDTEEREVTVSESVYDEYSVDTLYISITYYINPRFVVMDFVYSIRDTFVKFKQPTIAYEAMPITVSASLDVDTARQRSSGGVGQGDY